MTSSAWKDDAANSSGAEFRLLAFKKEDGARNMAIDQAILDSVDAGGPATLRFYGWNQPTLSLGYFQKLADRQGHITSAHAGVVRRSSGGGAILHDRELTYSVCVPQPRRTVAARLDLVDVMHAAASRVLSGKGIQTNRNGLSSTPSAGDRFLCFQRRSEEDLICSGYKVLGSAQRRGRQAILQHGSLLLHASQLAPELPGAGDLTGQPLSAADLAAELCDDLNRTHRWQILPNALTAAELERTDQMTRERYAATNWTEKR